MILDGLEFPKGKKLTCDVVVIGSGAAGVTLALELGKAGKDVIVLEGGGKKIELPETPIRWTQPRSFRNLRWEGGEYVPRPKHYIKD